MINQLLAPYNFSRTETNCIALAVNNWDSGRKCITQLKINLNIYLDTHQQEKCCYCGLLYDRTGRGEIEHIAPKGAKHYPQFCFVERNLAKACQLCNSSSMKHMYDTIETLSPDYDDCIFKIVHPYLDDHNLHYQWHFGIRSVIISVANNSSKAKESIRLFELDSVKRTRARASQRNQERLESLYNITNALKIRIRNAVKFRQI
jgi:uncharacterized protein (TIGR02646 family)